MSEPGVEQHQIRTYLAAGHRHEEAERESDETVDLPCNIFGFPVVWTEEMPMFDVVLADWPGRADWQRYFRRKEKEIAAARADMDYRELLKKYIEFIGKNEGIDYLHFVKPPYISKEEWEELIVLSLEPLLEEGDV